MVSLTKALNVAGTTRNAFNYWMRAGLLKTDFKETTPGVARSLSRENVLELAYLAAITHTGLAPKDAQPVVSTWCWMDQHGERLNFVAWKHDATYAIHFQNITMDDLANQLGAMQSSSEGLEERAVFSGAAISFTVINLGEIRRRVDALFEETEQQKEN